MKADESSPVDWISTAAIVAFCLAMLVIPWEQLWGARFVDRGVYLNRFGGFRPQASRTFAGGVLSFITNEVLWDMTVRWFTETLRLNVEILFGMISFLCLFVFSKYLASRRGLVSLIFLVNPLVIDFAFSQLRMALAISLLMLAMFRRDRTVLVILLTALACCIHTATFLFLFIYFAARMLSDLLSDGKAGSFYHWLALSAIGAAVVLVIGPLRGSILSVIGDRRVEYDNVAESIRYASFWILLLLTTATQEKKYFKIEGNAVAVSFLSVFACATFLNVYNVRFISAAYPLIISSILSLSAGKKTLIAPIYFFYAAAQWYYWLGAGLQR